MRSRFNWSTSPSRGVTMVFFAGLLIVFSSLWQPSSAPLAAQGRTQVRQSPRPPSFKSGGARSEIVLREISQTLKSIDARLGRIETTLNKAERAIQDSGAK